MPKEIITQNHFVPCWCIKKGKPHRICWTDYLLHHDHQYQKINSWKLQCIICKEEKYYG